MVVAFLLQALAADANELCCVYKRRRFCKQEEESMPWNK